MAAVTATGTAGGSAYVEASSDLTQFGAWAEAGNSHAIQTSALAFVLTEGAKAGAISTTSMVAATSLVLATKAGATFNAPFGCMLYEAARSLDLPEANCIAYALLQASAIAADVLTETFIISVTLKEGAECSAIDALYLIAQETLAETATAEAFFVIPATSTTWVINTRTNAISEYQNFAFNSFARVGRKFIGANENGLYELDGDTDDGTDIAWAVRNGMMQMNATRLSGLKGVYLGMRTATGGDFCLKLIAGDGREYVYAFKAQPGQMTSKVEIGRGLRSRYFAFELSGTVDVDLDSFEFVPLTPQRRV